MVEKGYGGEGEHVEEERLEDIRAYLWITGENCMSGACAAQGRKAYFRTSRTTMSQREAWKRPLAAAVSWMSAVSWNERNVGYVALDEACGGA